MNLLEARLERMNGNLTASIGSQRITIDAELITARPALAKYESRDVILGIRPEEFEDAALVSDVERDRCIRGEVELTEALGAEHIVHFDIDAQQAFTEDVRELAEDVGATAVQELERSKVDAKATVVGRFGARSRVGKGDTAEVAVDTRVLHFFDPETNLGIYD